MRAFRFPLALAGALAAAAGGQGAAPTGKATLTVRVPADAVLTIDGAATTPTGALRTFVSDGLRPGVPYVFELKILADLGLEDAIELSQA
jgi:uncharacterized protein (TIGR03000 family)